MADRKTQAARLLPVVLAAVAYQAPEARAARGVAQVVHQLPVVSLETVACPDPQAQTVARVVAPAAHLPPVVWLAAVAYLAQAAKVAALEVFRQRAARPALAVVEGRWELAELAAWMRGTSLAALSFTARMATRL